MSVRTWLNEFGTKTDLEKFIGLRKENIEKHGCFLNKYMDLQDSEGNKFLIACTELKSPWMIFLSTGNPEPMIKALTRISGEGRTNDI
jgi:hypothetical protein